MFERFTERARQVVVLAQDEARALRHNYIGTEHLLLGLLREEEGLAARVLDSLDLELGDVRPMVTRIVGRGNEVTSGQIPFTPHAKTTLELALREALALGHNYIGTEHILLGLVRLDEGVAAEVLLRLDADRERIRDEVIRMIAGSGHHFRYGAPKLERFELRSPPVAPEVVDQLHRLWEEIQSAISGGDAATAWRKAARYELLGRAGRRLERAWLDEEDDHRSAG